MRAETAAFLTGLELARDDRRVSPEFYDRVKGLADENERLRDENEVLRNFLRAMDPLAPSLTPAQFKEKYGLYLSPGGDHPHGD